MYLMKNKFKPIFPLSLPATAAMIISEKEIRRAAYSFIGAVLRDFFMPQFLRSTGISSREIVSVDHPLDKKIPFRPEAVKTYLSFIEFWVGPLVHLYRVGGKKTVAGIVLFLEDLTRFYKGAGDIYRTVHSTTVRPRYVKNMRFAMIHLLDPHFNCVPSLHVIIAAYSYHKISRLAALCGDVLCATKIQQELEDKACAIVESVLFIKQHSVNCVASGLFFLSSHYAEYTDDDAFRFISKLFRSAESALPDGEEIRRNITDLFCEFKTEYALCGDCRYVLSTFLAHYRSFRQIPQGESVSAEA